jgi:enoyl-CoA hydratase/carnithine racemase
LNALNTTLGRELGDFFLSLAKQSKANLPRAVVLTGEGRAFCAGADLKQRQSLPNKTWLAQHRNFESAERAISRCPVPLIAAVNGVAFVGGLELVLLADLVVASVNASFAAPEVKLGIIPGMGGTQRLPRRIGQLRAMEMLLTGRVVSASEALEWGLVNRLVPEGRAVDEAITLASVIAANAPTAIREAKRSIQRGIELPLNRAVQEELRCYKRAFLSGERLEGMKAFEEKRRPRY